MLLSFKPTSYSPSERVLGPPTIVAAAGDFRDSANNIDTNVLVLCVERVFQFNTSEFQEIQCSSKD